MNPHLNRATTLIELLIAISLIGIVILGFSSIDLFSRYQILTSDKRAKVQNEVSYVLEHKIKEIINGIGDVNQTTVDTTTKISGDPAIRVWVDANSNGKRDAYPDDHQIAYRYRSSGTERHQIWYYAVCRGANCNQSGSTDPEVIARSISAAPTYGLTGNYLSVEITGCWDPAEATTKCGTSDNPTVTMKTRIKMPAVSTH